MRIATLVEPIPGGGFRASCGGPFDLSAEGATAEEAVEQLKGQLRGRLAAGAHVVEVELPEVPHAWMPYAGIFRDDPLFDEWQQAIAENRRIEDSAAP
jgi:hypothetical protein